METSAWLMINSTASFPARYRKSEQVGINFEPHKYGLESDTENQEIYANNHGDSVTRKQPIETELPVSKQKNEAEGFTQSVIKRDTHHAVSVACLVRTNPNVLIRGTKKHYFNSKLSDASPRYSEETILPNQLVLEFQATTNSNNNISMCNPIILQNLQYDIRGSPNLHVLLIRHNYLQ